MSILQKIDALLSARAFLGIFILRMFCTSTIYFYFEN